MNQSEKKQFNHLILLMILVAILDFFGLAAILYLLQTVSENTIIPQYGIFSFFSKFLNLEKTEELLVNIGVIIFIFIGISSLLKIIFAWYKQKYAWNIAHKISQRMLISYLNKPYSFFVKKKSSDLITNILIECTRVAKGIIIPMSTIVAQSLVTILVFALLVIIKPKITILVTVILILTFALALYLFKNLLKKLGGERLESNRNRYLSLRDVISGIKTVKTSNSERYFYNKYSKASNSHSKIEPLVDLLSAVPKNLIDFILLGGAILAVLILFQRSEEMTTHIPIIAFYVLAGHKLLPALQDIFISLIHLKHDATSLEIVIRELTDVSPIQIHYDSEPLDFNQTIKLKNISLIINHEKRFLLNDINIHINKGEVIGIIGSSGSGKTTLIDVLVGLVQPNNGQILIDDTLINKDNFYLWKKQIGYIPQDVFLTNDTVARNIALGEEDKEINMQLVKKVAKIAGLKHLKADNIDIGLETIVGEYGLRLSGGERQRIGVARALYKDPPVLILDEATNALDNISEEILLNELLLNYSSSTILLIAHRLSSIKSCDRIFILEDGRIQASGTYNELVEHNELFQTMLKFGAITSN